MRLAGKNSVSFEIFEKACARPLWKICVLLFLQDPSVIFAFPLHHRFSNQPAPSPHRTTRAKSAKSKGARTQTANRHAQRQRARRMQERSDTNRTQKNSSGTQNHGVAGQKTSTVWSNLAFRGLEESHETPPLPRQSCRKNSPFTIK